jgi:hypothetical protein
MITKPLTQLLKKGTPFQWTPTSQATFDVSSSLATNISNTKLVLLLLEILEQFRDLSFTELNFKWKVNFLTPPTEAILEAKGHY